MLDEKILTDLVEITLNEVIQDIGKKLARELKQKLGPEGEYYSRTGEVINALLNPPKVKVVGGKINYDLFDKKMISMKKSLSGEKPLFHRMDSFGANKGATSYGGVLYNEMIMDWLDEGFKLPSGRRYSGLHYIKGALGTEDISSYMTKNLSETIIKYIKMTRGGVQK